MKDERRTEYDDPSEEVLKPNMMLRIGRGKDQTKWEPAISVAIHAGFAHVIMHPGAAAEYDLMVPIKMIRRAWLVEGIDFYELTHKYSRGRYRASRPAREFRVVH